MLVVPFGRRRLLGVVVDVAAESELPPERLAEPIAALEADVPPALVSLGLWVAREYVSTPARGLALVLPPGTGTGATRPLKPRRSLRAELTDDGRRTAHGFPRIAGKTVRTSPRLGEKQRAALVALSSGPLPVTEITAATGCGHGTLRSLENRGLVKLTNAAHAPKRPDLQSVGARTEIRDLTAAQAEAVKAIATATEPLLLHGVTGSGKTEVY